jgi:hypothetical protein
MDSQNRYLGAVSTVVRWTEAQYRSLPILLRTDALLIEGRLAAYVHPLDSHHAATIVKQLAQTPASRPEDLEDELLPREGAKPVALVYLSYGGLVVYGDEGLALGRLGSLGKLRDTQVKIRYNNVEGALGMRPLFIVDAPYSGRVLRDGQKFCGFAQATLTQVASGFIGTLAQIDRKQAARLAEEFLKAAQKGMKPAQLLREFRAEAAERMKNTALPKLQREREFLHTFMYVYYGNPLAEILVSP